jgi:hypothetical protein
MRGLIRAILLIVVAVPFAIYLFVKNRMGSKRRPSRPATAPDIAKAERALGFALPGELSGFFLSPRPGLRMECAAPYSLGEAVREYRRVTRAPYGPDGEEWPRELFPFADLLPGYACYDLGTGLVTLWDPDELGGEDDDPRLWDLSFRKTGKRLAEWVAGAD